MQVEVYNRQRRFRLDLARLRSISQAAAPHCLSYPASGSAVLPDLSSVEVTIVTDRAIAEVHRRFLGLAGPTDVITFDHGEIVVSATTAAREAADAREPVERELSRYIIHGLLHLNGHLDENPGDAAAMWQAQETILASLWPAG